MFQPFQLHRDLIVTTLKHIDFLVVSPQLRRSKGSAFHLRSSFLLIFRLTFDFFIIWHRFLSGLFYKALLIGQEVVIWVLDISRLFILFWGLALWYEDIRDIWREIVINRVVDVIGERRLAIFVLVVEVNSIFEEFTILLWRLRLEWLWFLLFYWLRLFHFALSGFGF